MQAFTAFGLLGPCGAPRREQLLRLRHRDHRDAPRRSPEMRFLPGVNARGSSLDHAEQQEIVGSVMRALNAMDRLDRHVDVVADSISAATLSDEIRVDDYSAFPFRLTALGAPLFRTTEASRSQRPEHTADRADGSPD